MNALSAAQSHLLRLLESIEAGATAADLQQACSLADAIAGLSKELRIEALHRRQLDAVTPDTEH